MSGFRARLLLVGPLPIEDDVIGGTKVLFAELAERFERSARWEAIVVNSSRALRGKGPLRKRMLDFAAFLRVARRVWTEAPDCEAVLLNASTRGAFASVPLLRALCRLRGVPLAVRLFGGDLGLRYCALGPLRRAVVRRTLFACDLLLLETEGLCAHFADEARVRRFPNTRDLVPAEREPRASGGTRFLFLGQVRWEKGFLHALEASDGLSAGSTVEFHGPPMDGVDPAMFDAHPNAHWRGSVAPEQVPALLARHDVLLFPTLYPTEGMPGSVLEAMQAGLPVIASRWPAAHELIEDGRSGLLVDVGSTPSLARAMRVLDRSPSLRARLAERARDVGDRYRGAPWHARLERWLDELVDRVRSGAEHSEHTPAKEVA